MMPSMALSKAHISNLNPIVVTILLLIARPVLSCNYTAIFSFGDSLADTGNELISSGMRSAVGRFPYGETYFHRPTGRYSDGRIILDFIAQALGLPLLAPYLAGGGGEDFRHGVNFAVAGATAHENDFFRELGLNVTWTEYSLGAQIEWFRRLLPSIPFSDPGSSNILSKSLILMGEIGGNDYNHPLQQKLPSEKIRTYVPSVIKIISSAVDTLIQLGARVLVVPGITPLGCAPRYIAIYKRSTRTDPDYYDKQTGCIKWLNGLSELHNDLLQHELDRVRRRHYDATIIYFDYYEVAMSIYRSPPQFGFKTSLEACCGGDDPSNPSCGEERAYLCSDPSSCVSWDGVHYTEATYRIIANGLLEGAYAHPPLMEKCSSPQQISAY